MIYDLAQLKQDIENGVVDTVLVVTSDLQGRPVGKRVVGSHFVEHVLDEGIEACDYLIAVDVDMNPLEGYSFTNWETGYGDMNLRCDSSSARIIPWLESTALIICDSFDENGKLISVAPRSILKTQLQKAKELGFSVKTGTELEFYLFEDNFNKAKEKHYKDLTPKSLGIEDYQIFQTTLEEDIIRKIRNEMLVASIPIEFSKGEAGNGQHEINITYDEVLRCADNHMIFKNGVREIAALNDKSVTFMAKWSSAEVGSSCHVHSSLWSIEDGKSLIADADNPENLSALGKSWIAGQLKCAKEFAILYAPYINSYKRYVPGSWAPTAIAWGRDNRTCGFRLVGKGKSMRIENRIPGADVNPYITLAATVAAGLYGIENKLELEDCLVGNGYTSQEVERIPSSLDEAIGLFENSEIAKQTLGTDVFEHLLNTAKQELKYFNAAVTDWELNRNFERI